MVKKGKLVIKSLALIFVMMFFLSTNIKALSENQDLNDKIFDLKVKTYMKRLKAPSLAVCVIKNDTVVWSDTYGYSNIYLRKKTTLDTIYTIGSISKCVTGTAVMQLIENESNNVDLDDNVSEWLPFDLKNPNFPNVNITFRMLLGHRSSLLDSLSDLLNIFQSSDDIFKWVQDHIVHGGKYYKQDYWGDIPPGENCTYSSFAFVVLSLLVEQISGQNFDDYCQENMFQPLNMTNTSYEIERLDKKKFARPYFPSLLGYIPFFHYDAKVLAPCGGLRTTANDLSHFLIAHMNNGIYNNVRILKNSTVELMHALYDANDTGYWFHGGNITFGLGWAHLDINGKHWEGYNGGAVGYSCDMATIASENVGVVILSNNHFYRFMTPYYDRYQWHDPLASLLLEKAQ